MSDATVSEAPWALPGGRANGMVSVSESQTEEEEE